VLTDKPVESVTIPAEGGEMGVLPGHAPFVVQLREGLMHYKDGQHKEVFSVLSGFAEINNNRVLVLAEAAELSKEIDEERAKQAWRKAKDAIAMQGDQIDIDEAQASLKRAAVRLKLAEYRKKHK
jgi:F-type H+-transporting ATPase subunit epsilon